MTQLRFDPRDSFRPAFEATAPGKVIFVGNGFRISRSMIEALKSEFDFIAFERVSSLSELMQLTTAEHAQHLVVLEESLSDQFFVAPDVFREAAGAATIVVSYFDVANARKLFDARNENDAFREIGFLPLNVQMDVWLSAMRLLICGEVFYPRELLSGTDPGGDGGVGRGVEASRDEANLTSREWEVLSMVAEGLQNKQIASAIALSEHTVKLHIHNILKKLGVSNRTCAANWFAMHQADRGR